MRKGKLFFVGCLILCACSSMKCNDNNPGPETIAEGEVTDAVTGRPIAGLQLKISSQNSQNSEQVITKADGSYYIKFTPLGDQSYFITPGAPYNTPYNSSSNSTVYLGVDNIINLKLYQTVNLTIHLINNSSYSKQEFNLYINGDNNYFGNGGLSLYPARKIDTTFTSTEVYSSYYIIESEFFNTSVYLGKVDTTVNIINP